MTASETQCRNWIKKTYPKAIILKIPDFKQTGNTHSAGWPDFLVVDISDTFFIEVKTWKAKTFTPAQLYMFPRIQDAGGLIYVWEKQKRGHNLFIFHTERKEKGLKKC